MRGERTAISNDGERRIEPSRPGPQIGRISNAFLFLQIFAFAAAVPCLLRLKLSRVAGALEPCGDLPPVDENRVRKITAYVETAMRRGSPLVRPGCLTRGVTRYYFFRRCGMDVGFASEWAGSIGSIRHSWAIVGS
jgi:hypothetical protein